MGNSNETKLSYKSLAWISLGVLIVVTVVNFSAAAGLINGLSQKAVSAKYPTMITPAGYAFSIWGIIYTLLLVAMVLTLVRKTDYYATSIRSIAGLFWLSSLFNVAWIFSFSYDLIGLSALLIVCVFVSLFALLRKLANANGKTKGMFDLGFGIYTGWLAIASVVNAMAFLVSINFGFVGVEKVFYTVLLVVFIVVVLLLQRIHQNPVFNLSIAWAFLAIMVRLALPVFDYMSLVLIIGSLALLGVSIASLRGSNWAG